MLAAALCALPAALAQTGQLQCTNGVVYRVWDNDGDTTNDLAGVDSIDAMRRQCLLLGLRPVRLQSAAQVHTVLRPLVQQAGYNLTRASGVPLGYDYAEVNSYQALDDVGVAVSPVMLELDSPPYSYTGDHGTDSTSSGELVAGFGWGASATDVGISDWALGTVLLQALICSDNAPESGHTPSCDFDRVALLAFRAGGDPNGELLSWLGSPCSLGWNSLTAGWWGVQCSSEGGRVTILDLHGTAVAGSIESLVPLTALQEIKLHQTSVAGVIDSLAPLTALQVLNLHSTQVTGRPPSLDPCVLLTSLTLYDTGADADLGVLATRGSTLVQLYPNCPPGQYWQSGSSLCTDCVAGKYSPLVGSLSVNNCADCSAGKYAAAAGSGGCTDCTAGKYLASVASTSASDCVDCVAGKYIGADDSCAALGGVFIGWEGVCVPRCVMLGEKWNDDFSDCQDCEAGRAGAAAGSSTCADCAMGKYIRVAASTSCIDCAVGKYLDTLGNDHSFDCIDCVSGKYLTTTGNDDVSDCIDCPMGRYIDLPATTDCIDCPVGKYLDSVARNHVTDCIDCVAGKYATTLANVGATDCIDCVAGKYLDTVGNDDASDCIDCPAGRQNNVASSSSLADCIDCVVGKYLGTTGNDDATDCIDCAVGKYLGTTGHTTAAECIDCVSGKYLTTTGNGDVSDCIDCPMGRYIDLPATTDCIDCPVGKYLDSVARNHVTDCIDCVAGKYATTLANVGATDCIDCVAGKYLDTVGNDDASDCIDCVVGKYTGTVGADEESDCIECAAGKYLITAANVDATSCIDCVAGKYAYASGRDTCINCPIGTFSLSTGSATSGACISCPLGKYNDGEGSTECYDCTSNSNTASAGAHSVAQCVCSAGYSGILARVSSTCNTCPADTYKANLGLPVGRAFNPLDDFNTIREYETPGQYTYQVPSGVSKLLVYVWGAGGGGGSAHLEEASGGGGGGFSMQHMLVYSGQQYIVVVGAGGDSSAECATCTGTAADPALTCDFDPTTDGIATCPAGCVDTSASLVDGAGAVGADSSFGTVVATGGSPGRNQGGAPASGGTGGQENGQMGGPAGGAAGGGAYGGGEGGSQVDRGTQGAGGGWPGGGSSGRSYCALSPEDLDQTLVSGGHGGVIVVAGPTSALSVRDCTACLPNSFTGAATTITTLAGCQCGPGYQGQLDDTTAAMCVQCPQDTFKSTAGTQTCALCADYATTVGVTGAVSSTSCICSRGYTGDGTLCTECAANTYKASRGDGVCVACTADSTTVANIAAPRVGACVCDSGYEALSGSLQTPTSTCEPCAANTYKAAQVAQLCTACTGNSATNGAIGSLDVDACLCDNGYTGNLNTPDALCAPCAQGKYKSAIGTADCVACPLNSDTFGIGAQSVIECLCDLGWFGALTLPASTCTVCAADKYKSAKGPDACNDCPVGAGTVGIAGSISVYNCSCQIGNEIHVAPVPRSRRMITSCRVCLPDFYKDNAGPSRCVACTGFASTLGINGSVTVAACQCDPGYHGNIVSTAEICSECPVNEFKEASGVAPCDTCTSIRPNTNTNNLTARTLESDCVCAAGYGWFDDVQDAAGAPLCQECPIDTYKDISGMVSCYSCTAHSETNSLTGRDNVTDCLCDPAYAGTSTDGLFSGILSTPLHTCEECPADTYKDTHGTDACAACTGHSSTNSLTGRTFVSTCLCDPGYHSNVFVTDANGYTLFTGGLLDSPTAQCRACSQDTYKSTTGPGEASPDPCVVCTYQAGTDSGAKTSVSDCLCFAGYTGLLATPSDTCAACAVDTFKPVTGSEDCRLCPDHSSTWVLCGQPQIDKGLCVEAGSCAGQVPCIERGGQLRDSALVSMSDCLCDKGYTGTINTLGDQCDACPVDMYKDITGPGPGEQCVQCTANAGTVATTATAQVSGCMCDPGYQGTLSLDTSLCLACAVDKYKAASGVVPCEDCPGAYNTNGTTAAIACFCDPGFEFSDNDCVVCPVGKYKEDNGLHLCYSCPAHSTTYDPSNSDGMDDYGNPTVLTGRTSVSDCMCDTGYNGTVVNQDSVCAACAVSSYKSRVGDHPCVHCTAHAVTLDVGQSLVGDCKCQPGYVCAANCFNGNIAAASAQCAECPAHQYKSYTGGFGIAQCTNCPANAGTWASDDGTVVRTAIARVDECICKPGYYGRLMFASSKCELCRDNSYKTDHSIHNCNQCPMRSFTFGELGSTAAGDCQCDIGYVGTITSRFDTCNRCEMASYKGSRGEQLCTMCPANMETDPKITSVALRDCFCALGYVGRPNEAGKEVCIRCEWDMPDPTGCEAFPPQATVDDLEYQLKVSPTARVALLGGYRTRPDPNEPVTFAWKAWEEMPDNSSVPLDITLEGVLASKLTGINIVIREAVLKEGSSYRFRIIVTGRIASASYDSIFTMNVRPTNGSLTVDPLVGVAIESRFTLTADYWMDEDEPLSYKYGFELRGRKKWLTGSTGNSSTLAMLPPGSGGVNISTANFTNITSTDGSSDTYELVVRVADAYDASRDARTNVTVMPYVKVEGISWADDMLAQTNVSGGEDGGKGIGASQAYTAAAETLNSLDTSEEDVAFDEVNVSALCKSKLPCTELYDWYGGWPTTSGADDNVCAESDAGLGLREYAPALQDALATDPDGDGDWNLQWRGATLIRELAGKLPTAGLYYLDCDLAGQVHQNGNKVMLRNCVLEARAVCSKLCDDVARCSGYQLKTNNAAPCWLFSDLEECSEDEDCERGEQWQDEDCDGETCATAHYKYPDQCKDGFCTKYTNKQKIIIGIGSSTPSLMPLEADPEAECVNEATWSEAVTACINIGARLCTQAELQNNEAAGTGCFEEDEMVWTSEDIQCAVGQHMSVCGYSGGQDSEPPTCMEDTVADVGIRCCADVDTTGHPCIDPNAPPPQGLNDDLGNARGQMVEGMAGGTEAGGSEDDATMNSGAIESLTASADQLDDSAQDASLGALGTMINPPAAAASSCYELRCGRKNKCDEDPYCAPTDELHEVHCCSDTELDDWKTPKNECLVYGAPFVIFEFFLFSHTVASELLPYTFCRDVVCCR